MSCSIALPTGEQSPFSSPPPTRNPDDERIPHKLVLPKDPLPVINNLIDSLNMANDREIRRAVKVDELRQKITQLEQVVGSLTTKNEALKVKVDRTKANAIAEQKESRCWKLRRAATPIRANSRHLGALQRATRPLGALQYAARPLGALQHAARPLDALFSCSSCFPLRAIAQKEISIIKDIKDDEVKTYADFMDYRLWMNLPHVVGGNSGVNLFPMNNVMIKIEPPSSPEMTTPVFDNPTPKESLKSDQKSIARRAAHSCSKCYQLESLLDDIQNLKDRVLSLVKDLGNATEENEKEATREPVCVECIPLD
ncbi:hypothetical protein L484_020483 [Morus notabilis]|uniref:Uncharacterized protein n=1 Tax=Morus notabilis TaxID=981085 RepID=W9SBL7_9ROSA|nr:hypothetical protein L484_020483 [Morus notabilis]